MKLKDARVVTSKFLQLKDDLNNAIAKTEAARPMWNSPSNEEIACNVHRIQKAFGELCELLHELALEDS
jgi:hypothetical protein